MTSLAERMNKLPEARRQKVEERAKALIAKFRDATDGVSDVAERGHQVLVVGIGFFKHDIQIGRDVLGRFQVIASLMFS